MDKSIADATESDLEQLISSGVQENARVEYKPDVYGSADADKKELLKDVSSLANTFGGHLIRAMDPGSSPG